MSLSQVYVGVRPKSHKQKEKELDTTAGILIEEEKDTYNVDIGDFVATNLQLVKYSDEWPQIGRVTKINEDRKSMSVECGTYSDPWQSCHVKQHGKYVPWTEDIHSKSVILAKFVLTTTLYLRKKTFEHLKHYHATKLAEL